MLKIVAIKLIAPKIEDIPESKIEKLVCSTIIDKLDDIMIPS
jgi:hypothetical protein